ncbi:MAG: hypothetical protein CM1200mP24_09310 [Gammaproteobacteria bacterium]|nr:MAG: hypothetical protein CM1200mP24_09310 [Gammaproteobacteria bacterium]
MSTTATRRLEGKVAVITGAGSGMGRATALRFLQEGASVMVADLNESTGLETVSIAKAQHLNAVDFVTVDVSTENDVENMIKNTIDRFDRIDCIFNNAGVGEPLVQLQTLR